MGAWRQAARLGPALMMHGVFFFAGMALGLGGGKGAEALPTVWQILGACLAVVGGMGAIFQVAAIGDALTGGRLNRSPRATIARYRLDGAAFWLISSQGPRRGGIPAWRIARPMIQGVALGRPSVTRWRRLLGWLVDPVSREARFTREVIAPGQRSVDLVTAQGVIRCGVFLHASDARWFAEQVGATLAVPLLPEEDRWETLARRGRDACLAGEPAARVVGAARWMLGLGVLALFGGVGIWAIREAVVVTRALGGSWALAVTLGLLFICIAIVCLCLIRPNRPRDRLEAAVRAFWQEPSAPREERNA